MKPEDLLLAANLDAAKASQYLKKFGFKDPEGADRNLQLMGEEISTRLILSRIIKSLLEAVKQSPDPDAALIYFERLFANLAHSSNFLGFLGDTPEALEALISLLGTSPFCAEILIRNPEYFYWILDELGTPWVKSAEAYFQEAQQIMEPFEEGEQQLRALGRFKRREMLRISSRDILRITDVVGTMTELSNLADTVLQSIYSICFRALARKHGSPSFYDDSGLRREARFTILAMGKLGGRELNYSSDIDLIYVYDGENGNTVELEAPTGSLPLGDSHPGNTPAEVPIQSNPRSISNPEFFTKLAQAITHELSTMTEEGYFYRVDLRLRPEGSAGPVASSLNACRNYYSSWGETFERMALIKARPAAGSLDLGEEFCLAFTPFVYRKFLDFAALEEIQEIKTRIESKLASRKKPLHHVKLGAGGIREIEFFAQALQLIYGGRVPQLRERSTIKALGLLQEHQLISMTEKSELLQAYSFLRDLEHKLQMVNEFQAHELPEDEEELYKCARRMGFKSKTQAETIKSFLKKFDSHTAHVQDRFQKLISHKRHQRSGDQIREAFLILNKNLSKDEALEILAKPGFEDLQTAYHHVCLLRDAPSFAHSPAKMRNLLANLMPSLLETLRLSPDPDAGLSYFEQFASALGARDALYSLLNESPEALHSLIQVLSTSQFLADYLCRNPEFLDAIIKQEFNDKPRSLEDFQQQIREVLSEEDTFDLRLQSLRHFHEMELFRVQVMDVLDQCNRPQAGQQLAGLAESTLEGAIRLACQKLEAEGMESFQSWAEAHFVILALGKFGGNDLSYQSDLDLIYFYSVDSPDELDLTQRRLVRLVEAIDHILSVSTGRGAIYKIDTRLRPEGKKGGLVTPLLKYQEYLHRRAQPWERLAMVRHRILMGTPRNSEALSKLVEDFVFQPELSPVTVKEIAHVRHRMEIELAKEAEENRFHLKAGIGGLVDIEFAVQMIQLKHGAKYHALRVPNTLEALRVIRSLNLLSRSDFEILYLGYEFLRFLENRLRIASPFGSGVIQRDEKSLGKMSRLIGYSSLKDPAVPRHFERAYLDITQSVRKVYQKIIAQVSET
ncbi:MAG: bifunctional [glutamate--ammonia ligase]-adenylyl-L-tyrosine phosphorylase/[glutamate--ammonia-ligase] adenylyltransferase [Terriglobia bacterium]